MALERKLMDTSTYRGHKIEIRYLGPDLLCYVDGSELSPFYESVEDARKGGMRHIDHIENEKAKQGAA